MDPGSPGSGWARGAIPPIYGARRGLLDFPVIGQRRAVALQRKDRRAPGARGFPFRRASA